MTIEQWITETVRQVVAEAVEPLRRELVALRRRQAEAGPVTMTEAAKRLGVSTKTIRRRVLDGSIRVVGVGATKRVVLPSQDAAPE